MAEAVLPTTAHASSYLAGTSILWDSYGPTSLCSRSTTMLIRIVRQRESLSDKWQRRTNAVRTNLADQGFQGNRYRCRSIDRTASALDTLNLHVRCYLLFPRAASSSAIAFLRISSDHVHRRIQLSLNATRLSSPSLSRCKRAFAIPGRYLFSHVPVGASSCHALPNSGLKVRLHRMEVSRGLGNRT